MAHNQSSVFVALEYYVAPLYFQYTNSNKTTNNIHFNRQIYSKYICTTRHDMEPSIFSPNINTGEHCETCRKKF